jgi:hypothetical protein
MKKILFGLVTSFIALFTFVPNSYAKVMVQEKGTVTISSNEVVNDDLYIAAENIEVLGTVNGDVYVAGGQVKVDGKINGDLIVGGGTVTISGKIKDDVYVGGGNITIQKSSIGDSLVVVGGSLTVDKNSTIGGSLMSGTGMVDNNANVGRNLFVGAGSVSVNSKVGGEARIGAGEIKIGEETSINKDLYYTLGDGNSEIVIPATAKVLGNVHKVEPVKPDVKIDNKNRYQAAKYAKGGLLAISFFGALLVGIIAIKLASKEIEKIANRVKESVLTNVGAGFLILTLTVPLSLVVMFTIIGAQLSFVTLAIFGLLVYFAKLVTALALGSAISSQLKWKLNHYLNFVLGLAILFGFKYIPIVGGFVSFVFTCVGLGAIIRSIKHRD